MAGKGCACIGFQLRVQVLARPVRGDSQLKGTMLDPEDGNEAQRLAALRRYGILDTAPEAAFDEIAKLAALICHAPMATVTFIDADRQWFKAEVGVGSTGGPSDRSICAVAVRQGGPLFVVPDVSADERFRDWDVVTGSFHLRFYGGAVLRTHDGHAIGSLCVLDLVPRELTPVQMEALQALARQVMTQLDLRVTVDELQVEREKLAQSNRHRRLALESAELGSWHVASKTMELTTDARFDEIFGIVAESVSFERALAAIHPEDRERVQAAVAAAMRPETPNYAVEYRVVHADNRIRWVFAKGRANFGEDGSAASVTLDGTVADITDRVEAEQERRWLLEAEKAARSEAERASHVKDEFLATLSHELRTPLNAILGWAHILTSPAGQGMDVAQGLEVIERNARVQAQLIEDLLDMSRIISGKVRLNVQEVELRDVVRSAVASVQHSADAKDIRLQVVLDSLPGPVRGDPNRLQQCFWNLLSNAIKFTPKGGRVQVALAQVNSHVEVCVTDSGRGIESAFLPHVFERFKQADSSTTRQHGGLGLGLSIVKSLVELHGGSVSVHSDGAGTGARFCIELPLTALREDQKLGPRTHPRAGGALGARGTPGEVDDCGSLAGLKVLVVDDEKDARDLVKRVLEDCGAAVVTAHSCEEGLMALRREKPDMIVSDIGMPGEDGYTFIRSVRRLAATEGGKTPAAALTAFARAEDRTRALRAGFQTHLAKPVEPAELVAVVASLVFRSSGQS